MKLLQRLQPIRRLELSNFVDGALIAAWSLFLAGIAIFIVVGIGILWFVAPGAAALLTFVVTVILGAGAYNMWEKSR